MSELSKTDEKIQDGVSRIDERLAELSMKRDELSKMTLRTNARFRLPDMSAAVNIRTLSPEELTFYRARVLAISPYWPEDMPISGFPIFDWTADFDYLAVRAKVTAEHARLTALSNKLKEMYTDDKKKNDAIDELLGEI